MLLFGLQVTALGFGLVLIILVALMIVMQTSAKIMSPKPKAEPKQEIVSQPANAEIVPVQKEDEAELYAVIAAAIAASGEKVYIKAINRINGTNGAAWSASGRTEAMNLRQL